MDLQRWGYIAVAFNFQQLRCLDVQGFLCQRRTLP
jgi:hypothetical protein